MTIEAKETEREKRIQERMYIWDFPGGLVVKNLPSNAGDAGSIPGGGTKIPCATGQLSPCATTREKPTRPNRRSCMLQRRSCVPQPRPDAAK